MVKVSCRGIASLAVSLFVLPGIVLLGFNENRSVCTSRLVHQAEAQITEVGCDSESLTASDGKLVLLSCDVSKAGLAPIVAQLPDFALAFVGTGLRIEAEMFQCVEHRVTKWGEDNDGNRKLVTTYSYTAEWRGERVASEYFNQRAWCDENPQWPSGLLTSGVTYAPSVHVGAFMLSPAHVEKVPLSAPVYAHETPSGWALSSDGHYVSQKWQVSPLGIGMVRVKFWGTDWNHPKVTVLGQNDKGVLEMWSMSDFWFCSGWQLAEVLPGSISKADFFELLRRAHDDEQYSVWALRVVGFFLIWFFTTNMWSVSKYGKIHRGCVFNILPTTGGTIVFIFICLLLQRGEDPWTVGKWSLGLIGSLVSYYSCCLGCCSMWKHTTVIPEIGAYFDFGPAGIIIACLPSTACATFVIGIIWVAERPNVGVPLVTIGSALMISIAAYMIHAARMCRGTNMSSDSVDCVEP